LELYFTQKVVSFLSTMKRIHLPHPCEADASVMSPTERGSFCSQCQKEVVDFTQMSDQQIMAFFKRNGRSCGKFRADQLDRPLAQNAPKRHAAMLGGLMALATLGNITPAMAQTDKWSYEIPVEYASTPHLTLHIIDSDLKQDITDANLEVLDVDGANIHWEFAYISILLPQKIPSHSLRIKISARGYEEQIWVLPVSAIGNPTPIEVPLQLKAIPYTVPHTLRGRVVAKKTGIPLRGINVQVRPNGESIQTDQFGRFELVITDPDILKYGEVAIYSRERGRKSLLIREMSAFERIPLRKRKNEHILMGCPKF